MKTEEVAITLNTRRSLPTVRDVVTLLFRQRRVLFLAFAVAMAAAAVLGLWVPKYETEMKVLVRRQRPETIVTASATAPNQQFTDQVSEEDLNSEVQLLNSGDLLRKVAISTGLAGVNGVPTDRAGEVKVARAVRLLGATLKIEPVHKTNIISVGYQSRDPEMAARVLSSLGAAYLEKHQEVHRSSGEFKFFDQQMKQYQQGLDQAQAKLTDFTNVTGVVSADMERDSALRHANEFDAASRQAQSTLFETQRRVSQLEAQLQSMKPRSVTLVRTSDNSQLAGQLSSTLLTLQLKRTELLTKFAPTYPLVQEVDQQIAQTNSALAAEESKPIHEESSDRDPTYQLVKDDLTRAQTELVGLKARAASTASIAGQYQNAARNLDKNGLVQRDLLRAEKTQEENYLLYVHKREEARIGEALDLHGIVNVALAEQPVIPVLPVKSPLYGVLFSLLLAGIFSVSSAVAVDFMDPSFRTPDELANYLGTPVLAALPKGVD
jgi:uncharacterized protein involved in exopolysaccharide biosynthesis